MLVRARARYNTPQIADDLWAGRGTREAQVTAVAEVKTLSALPARTGRCQRAMMPQCSFRITVVRTSCSICEWQMAAVRTLRWFVVGPTRLRG